MVKELASQLNSLLLDREPRQMVRRVLEFEKIFDRYLKNNPNLTDAPLLEQLRSWLELAQPHYEEFEWLQYYLIIWLDKRGCGDIEIAEVVKLFATTINDYQENNFTLSWEPTPTKLLMNSTTFISN